LAPGKTRTFIDPDDIGQSGKASQEKQKADKGGKHWKTSVQLSRRHEKIVNEYM
jgi:hypothetical protein